MRSSSVRGGAFAVVAMLACACALAAADPPAALAACGSVTTASWSAPGSGDWSDGGNWSTGVVPDACTDVAISAANPPLDVTGIPVGAAVHGLSLGAGVRLGGGTLDAATLTWASSASAFDNHLATDLTVAGTANLAGDGTGFVDRVGGHGSLTLAGASSQLSWGTLQLSGGATLAVGGSLSVNASSLIEGATTGTVEVTGGLAATGGATVQVHAATLDVAGTLATPAGDLVLDSDQTTLRDGASIGGAGTVTLQGTPGATFAPGAVHLNGTAVLRLDAGTLSGAGAFTGSGGLAWRGGHIDGSLTVGNLDVAGPGDKHLDDGATLTTSAASTWTGSTVHGAGAALINTGVLSGDAALELQTLTNRDVVAPAGQLTVDGDYVQQDGALLDVDIAGDHHDRLVVTGSATLAGGVRPVTAAEYLPPIGASFTILEYASRSGALTFIEDDIVGDDREYALDTGATATALKVVEGGGPSFAVSDATTAEHGSVTIPVTLSPANGYPVSIHVATADGTARAGADYTAAAADLTFAAGETTKTIEVPISDDGADEPDETFAVRLSNPQGAWIKHPAATVTITDDDAPAGNGGTVTAPGGVTIDKPTPTPVISLADVCPNAQVLSVGDARVRGCFTGSGALKTAQGKVDVDGVLLEPSAGAKITVDTGTGEVKATNGGSIDAATYDPVDGAKIVLGRLAASAGGVVLRLRDAARGTIAVAANAKLHGMRMLGSIALRAGDVVGDMQLLVQTQLPALLGGFSARARLVTRAALRRLYAGASTIAADLTELAGFKMQELKLQLTSDGFSGSGKMLLFHLPVTASLIIDRQGTVRDAHVTGSGNLLGNSLVLNSFDARAYELSTGRELIGSIDVSGVKPGIPPFLTLKGAAVLRSPFGGPFTVEVPSGTVQVGSLALTNASFTMGPTSTSMAGTLSTGIPSLGVSASANVAGWTTYGLPPQYELYGAGEVVIPGYRASGDLLLGDKGLGACAGIDIHVGPLQRVLRVGFTHPAGQPATVWFDGCDLGPLRRTATASAAQAAAAADFTVSGGPEALVLAVHGDGAAPRPVLVSPRGERVSPVAAGPRLSGAGAMAFPDEASHTTYVLLAAPAVGRWQVVGADGSAAITRVETAEALAQPQVTAGVSGRGARRTLRWTGTLAPGDRVRFAEESGELHHVLGTTAKPHGALSFTPAAGRAGVRRITATVLRGGIPRATLKAGSYRAPAPAPLAAPRAVKLRRAKGGLAISWARVRGADRYEVRVRLRGARPATILAPHRTATVPSVLPSSRGTVQVRALPEAGPAGRSRTAHLRAAPAPRKVRRR